MHSQGIPATALTADGRTLYFQRRNGVADVPTVVFESGLAANRSYWAAVQVLVADRAPTVVYDRSGLGRSEPDPGGRSLPRLAADLSGLLDQLGEGPFLLVGHSWGGPIVRVAAAVQPERVAGLVLVDPSDEACDLLFHPSMRRAERIGQVASSLLARFGLLHRLYGGLLAALPADARADMLAEGFTRQAMRTRAAELESVVTDLQQLLDQPLDLGEIPVTVISAGRTSAGMSKHVREQADISHRYRAARCAGGRHVVAERAGHMVPTDQPQIIADEILRLLDHQK
ncbi:alpha/beta hydrolase [Pseudonocardiaceae bacterium YIM PH 21723]|nr:alpha/beta hydrolase [Pseudonocardiaceae bacterium YIM PH 21723]